MRVFITGGAGFLGINLIRALKEHGVSDIVSYDLADFDHPEREWVKVVKEDIRHVAPLREAMAGCDAVVHAAAATPLYTREDIMTTNLDGTRNVLQAALDLGIERVVHLSSAEVYGVPDHRLVCETDKLVGTGPYGEANVKAEAFCTSFREKDLCVAVLRPTPVVGPGRLGVLSLFFDWARDGHNFPLIGSGENRYQLLDVSDLCEAIWACLTLDKAVINDTFNLGATDFSTMKEDFQPLLDQAGFGKRLIGFPALPTIWALRALEAMHLSPLHRFLFETAAVETSVNTEKAQHKLGFKPRYANREALLRNFDWYNANLDSLKTKSGLSNHVPCSQGALGLIKYIF